ncbi:hypothetical protein GGR57DRAFT_436313 [Xylariaceae sp. FL1272]|nr:hypothetical protein GGR57DRAFT_436313 [Xylariaceae sp. FL1272]
MSKSRRIQSLAEDHPLPLHVVKRTKTMELRSSARGHLSPESVELDPDKPLSVRRKRQRHRPQEQSTSQVDIHNYQGNRSKSSLNATVPASIINDYMATKVVHAPENISKLSSEVNGSEDFDTPKARNTSLFRRLSKKDPTVNSSPRNFSGLRQLVHRRNISSNATQRRYDLRSGSTSTVESSMIHPSSEQQLETPFSLDGVDSSRSDYPEDSMIRSNFGHIEPCLLIPCISITPELTRDESGMRVILAAIEISAQLSPMSTESALDSQRGGFPGADDVSRYGYLYDLTVEVLPTPESKIIEVVESQQKRSISLKSSRLVLARIQLEP